MAKQLFYVGTYTHINGASRDKGIFRYAFDPADGSLELLDAVDVVNPSFLAFSPDRRTLYAVNELHQFAGVSGGGLSAFAVDASGALTFLNAQPTHGDDPCYITVDPSGKWVLVANYTSGSIIVFPIQPDGRLGKSAHLIQHRGRSVNPARQESAHAHCVVFDPSGEHLLCADLGMDQVFVYDFDPTDGSLSERAIIPAQPGAEPGTSSFTRTANTCTSATN